MNNKLARLFRTFQLWLEEPLLHDASLYLPSLPQQYQSDRLLMVFQNQTVNMGCSKQIGIYRHVDSEGPDQTVHPHSLIKAFSVHLQNH